MSDHLEKRKNLYYAVLTIPAPLRETLGKIRFIQSTGEADRRKAKDIASQLVAGWRVQIEQARGQDVSGLVKAIQFREDVKRTRDSERRETLEHALLDHVERLSDTVGEDKAIEFYEVASGRKTPSAPLYEQWKAQLQLTPKTIDQWSKHVSLFVTRFPILEVVTRKEIRLWLDDLIKQGATHSNLKTYLTACRNFWSYLKPYQLVDADLDPFSGVLADKKKAKSKTVKRSYFKADEIVELWEAAKSMKKGEGLANLIAIGAHTGMRLEEICSLKVSDVTDEAISVKASKTDAGVRDVPIHSKIKSLIKRLKDNSKDGYILSGLSFNKYGDRSNAIGKSFGKLKTKLGHGGDKVFHSLRHSFVTHLANAHVLQQHIADLVGHEKKEVTGQTYMHTSPLAVKREAIEKLRYTFPELK